VKCLNGVRGFITWRRVAIAEGFAAILILREWLGLEPADRFSRYMAIESISRLTSALMMLLAIALAEEANRRGARKLLSFGVGLTATSLLSSLLFTAMWFDTAWAAERSRTLFVVENSIEMLLWASLATIVFYNIQQTGRIREGLRQAQRKKLLIERGVLDSRLEAARKQIDAPALFEELTRIRDALRQEEPHASEALERLIIRMRDLQMASRHSETLESRR
jgi:hypothetical protein